MKKIILTLLGHIFPFTSGYITLLSCVAIIEPARKYPGLRLNHPGLYLKDKF